MPTAAALAQTATLVGGLYAIHGLRRWPDHLTVALTAVAAALFAAVLALAAPTPDATLRPEVFDPSFGIFAMPE